MRSTGRYILALFAIITLIYTSLQFIHETSPASSTHTQSQQVPEKQINFEAAVRTRDYPENDHSSHNQQHLLEYLDLPVRAQPYNFRKCSMSTCFNFSRCQKDATLKIHILSSRRLHSDESKVVPSESDSLYSAILDIIRNSAHFEPNPDDACLFVLEENTLDRDPLSQGFDSELAGVFERNLNFGMNFLLFNLYSGTWPDYKEDDFAGLHVGAAILAKASNSIARHRPNFDISLPLFSHNHPLSDIDAQETFDSSSRHLNRTYHLTFKGKRYVFGTGSETRNSLYHIDNKRDVIMLTTCKHGKKWQETGDSRCLKDDMSYDHYDFVDLMKKSVFCLTPRGRRLGSFRFLEALRYGCIPVILSDGFIQPLEEIIDWSNATIHFDENLLLLVPDLLRDLSRDKIEFMQSRCSDFYSRYLSTLERIILTTIAVIDKRVKSHT